ncbi:hypothetical protein ABS768_08405 [Flavobacterium sp. ST-75]|uniref:Uncharacterized protein n=1 Tax=Flavobacterium rhizophilum TaxID=3163296 RepID=A0ABW8YDV8_9FLAO
MKKFILLAFFFFTLNTAFAQTDNGWQAWQKTSCYSKIEFRLKYDGKNGEQHHWKVQFKNNYNNLISFNYTVTDKIQQYTLTTHRKTLNAGKQSEEIDLFTGLEDIYILVDKVSMTPYPENFIECE